VELWISRKVIPEQYSVGFFDSNQATDQLAQFLIILYGSGPEMARLAESCLREQSAFNDALGPEILFLFFDPDVPIGQLFKDGRFVAEQLTRGGARYLFAGYGEAHAVPPSMIEIGRARFRSEQPGSMDFSELATAASIAHSRAIPFFQSAFDLEPGENNLVFAHRKERTILLYDLGSEILPSAQDLIGLTTSMRKVARHYRGPDDLARIEEMIPAHLSRARLRNSARLLWNELLSLIDPNSSVRR
jgi:hypothetical protein